MSRILQVEVKILPPSPEPNAEEFNLLSEGAITEFEKWVISRRSKSGIGGEPLTASERGTIKAFLFFVATEDNRAQA